MTSGGGEPLFRGAAVALVTLFDADGRLQAEATGEHAAGLVAEGVSAVLVAGTTGEAGRLSPGERAELLAAVRAAVPADVPVLAGVGDPVAAAAVELARQAASGGAAGLLAHLPGDREPAPFFDEIRAVSDGAQVLAYHYPAHFPAVPVERLPELDIDGIKDSEGSAERLVQELDRWRGDVYTGSAALLPLAGPYGAAGAILALGNLYPRLCAQAFAGDIEAQRAMNDTHLAVKAGGVGVIKRRLAESADRSAVTR